MNDPLISFERVKTDHVYCECLLRMAMALLIIILKAYTLRNTTYSRLRAKPLFLRTNIYHSHIQYISISTAITQPSTCYLQQNACNAAFV